MASGAGYLSRRWERLSGPARLDGIDLARGLAVVGMLGAHLLRIPEIDPADPRTWLDVVNGRSSILFATLAGVSLALISGGPRPVARARRRVIRGRVAVRALLIWMLGMALIVTGVPIYVILPAYAILFLLALPFLSWRSGALFALAGALAVVMPVLQPVWEGAPLWSTPFGPDLSLVVGWHYPFPVWVVFILAGLAVGRLRLRSLPVVAAVLAAGAALAALGYGVAVVVGPEAGPVWTAEAHSNGLLEVIGSGGFALMLIAACLWVCRTPVRWIVLPVRAMGSMPLSVYTAQVVLWVLWQPAPAAGEGALAAFRSVEPFWPMTLGLLIASTAWALLIGRGPLEWLFARIATAIVPSRRG